MFIKVRQSIKINLIEHKLNEDLKAFAKKQILILSQKKINLPITMYHL